MPESAEWASEAVCMLKRGHFETENPRKSWYLATDEGSQTDSKFLCPQGLQRTSYKGAHPLAFKMQFLDLCLEASPTAIS